MPRVSVSDRPSVAGIPPRLLRSLLPLVTSRPHSRNPRVSCVRVFTRTYRPARLASRARLAFRLFSGPSELPCSVSRSSRDSRLASHPACIARANIPTRRLWLVNSSSRTEPNSSSLCGLIYFRSIPANPFRAVAFRLRTFAATSVLCNEFRLSVATRASIFLATLPFALQRNIFRFPFRSTVTAIAVRPSSFCLVRPAPRSLNRTPLYFIPGVLQHTQQSAACVLKRCPNSSSLSPGTSVRPIPSNKAAPESAVSGDTHKGLTNLVVD